MFPHQFIPARVSAAAMLVVTALSQSGCGGDATGIPGRVRSANAVSAVPAAQRDLTCLSIRELQDAYRDNRLSAEQVVQAYLHQVRDYEPAYNAFTFENQAALEQARAVDRARRNGLTLGPLAGVPSVIKESIAGAGYPSTAGWSLLAPASGGPALMPLRHAAAAQRLFDAGAILIGKGNMPTFADDNTRANSSWAGPTYNAIDRTIVPGGSSAGVATAVAAGFAAAGLAEETGGSIQSPSAAQSLVGIKPTFGLVPTSGVVPLGGSTRDVLGPIAGNVEDAAILLDVVAGVSNDDPRTAAARGRLPQGGYAKGLDRQSLRGKRIGLYGPGWREQELALATRALYQAAIAELTARGAVVVTDPFAGSGYARLALPNVGYDFRGTESAAHDLDSYLRGVGVASLGALKQRIGVTPFDEGQPLNWYVELLPVLKASLADPAAMPDLSQYAALKADYLRVFNSVMETKRLDAMVFPQAVEALPAMDDGNYINETTVSSLNIAGLPGVTVPAGRYPAGAPFSLIFVGRQWSEKSLIDMAYDYEQATRHRILPVLRR